MQARSVHHLHFPHGHGRDLNMVEGPLFGKVLVFALPLMLTNLLQTFYSAADMMVVSLSPNPNAVGGVGTCAAFINLVLNVFIGFSVGANVTVARFIGAKDDENTSKTVHTAVLLSALLGLLACVIGQFASRPILVLMGNDGALLDLALLYTRIYFFGVPFIAVSNYAISILRAKGDTRTPLVVLTCTGLLNVGLNLFFVLVLHRSVEGVAIATAAANAVSATVLLLHLSRDPGPCRFSLKKLRLHKKSVLGILHIGLPAGLQGALFSISNMMVQSSVLQVNNATLTEMGYSPAGDVFQPVVKGNTSSGNLEGFAYTATNSVAQAAVSFSSQNVGADKPERVWSVMRCVYFLTFCVAVVVAGSLILFRDFFFSLYGVRAAAEGTLDAVAYNTATRRMLWMLSLYFFLAFMEAGSCTLRGIGYSTASTISSLTGACLFRVVWLSTVFRARPTLDMIYITYPLSWALTAIASFTLCVVLLRRMIRKKRQREARPETS